MKIRILKTQKIAIHGIRVITVTEGQVLDVGQDLENDEGIARYLLVNSAEVIDSTDPSEKVEEKVLDAGEPAAEETKIAEPVAEKKKGKKSKKVDA